MTSEAIRAMCKHMASSHAATVGIFVLTAALPLVAHAEYPEKPVRIVVGFAAGTAPDIAARVLAQKLQAQWGKGVVVDNKDGAAGFLAAQEVARSPTDGYTLLFGAVAQISIAPNTYKKLPYDPQKDFAPIAQVANLDFVMVAPTTLPAKNLMDYVSWAQKESPMMGTFGAGTMGHFGAAMLASAANFKMEPVHYRRTGDAMTGVINGDAQGLFSSVALATPYITAGKITGLATTGASRSALLPQVPTFKELGYQDLDFTSWVGMFAPAKTPAPILDKINADIVRVLKDSDSQQALGKAGFTPAGSNRQDFEAFIQRENVRWANVVRTTGFKALD
ncbi:Bug family tripartite tricarboxylate transporter substrate binding protein [Azohydromonas lata]|uniref:Tripartite tricarboxylate transporter substrate binding protein n=1 Tax=Azohydromonas lata TaxID=45677 RepID=A0ABU5ILX0_9BURK|nr:tripartite tricarboxylate transporter substrate binding protein [Azohydromonas lata]MDZ5459900.1 tripartite tricarboxylate transporter substrate binding protein [Azohydromonas lata]